MVIPGPAGGIEAHHQPASRPDAAEAVLCHPHPLYGGSMHDGVLERTTQALLAAGVGVLRFNFRGVGHSDGRFDGGRGEVDDLLAAVRWLRERAAGAPLWLGGYSFGAHVVWQAAARQPEATRLLLVAPPIGPMTFPAGMSGCPVDVFAGDRDEFIDPGALAAWTGVRVHVIAGADHFFSGHLDDLAERLAAAIA